MASGATALDPALAERAGLASRISSWGVTLYAGLLPFHAFGKLPARRWLLLEPCELALLAVAPALLIELLRQRRQLARSWIVRGVALLTAAGILAELLATRGSRLLMLKEALGLLAVGGVASLVLTGRERQLLTGLLGGGCLALFVGALGYGFALASGHQLGGAFVFASAHPVFPGWPRMTGTLGRHAVWLGEYCVMLLAVALAADACVGSRALRLGARVAALLGLVASLSFAWLGGLVLLLRGWLARRPPASASRRRRYRALAALILLFAYAGASFWMLVGARVEPSEHESLRSCRELDGAHHVLRRGPALGMCQPILAAEPYPHRLTLYALAHQTAWQRFLRHPLLGAGRADYAAFARAHAAREHQLGPVGYYQDPVGLVAATLASTGLAGAAGLLVILYGVWRARPSASEPSSARPAHAWLFFGTLGLLLCGTQTDLELRGPLWVLLGLLAGLSGQQLQIAPPSPPE